MVKLAEYFEWFPITGETIILGDDDFILRSFDGTGNTMLNEQSQKAPFQRGETFLNVDPQPRRILINVRIADSLSNINQLKNKLARAFVSEPVRIGRGDLGLLRYHREGQDPVELRAIPVQSPQFTQITRKGNVIDADIEFFAPNPYWGSITTNSMLLQPDIAGLEFEMEFPFEMESGDAEVEIFNNGDVSIPVLIRVFGTLTTFTITNLTTDEAIRIDGLVEANQYVEINTEFGDKRVDLYEDGDFSQDIFGRLDVDFSTFFRLQRGINRIKLEAVENVDGSARIFWKERFAGV